MRYIDKIILHCSASNNPDQDSIQAIRKLHTSSKLVEIKWGDYDTQGREFIDVGYHYFIQSSGKIELGRDLDIMGAHCRGENTNSIGICLSGNEKNDFTGDQFIALTRLLQALVLLFPGVTIHGHNEFANKSCPVFDVTPFKTI
jgi:N-acetyl-anhydromuramyl-L-alanine amidase AmpD